MNQEIRSEKWSEGKPCRGKTKEPHQAVFCINYEEEEKEK
jgi:hypothetical protein